MTRARSPSRAPGRPQADHADLRQRLLDAALQRFAQAGILATPLREIARTAGVTPALVNYYFGGKDALVAAVFEERLMPVFGEVQARLAGAAAENLVESFVDAIHHVVERHPWLPALWVREILTEGGALRDGLLSKVAPRLSPLLAQRFAQMQREGRLNRDLDPRLMIVSLIGQTLFPLAARPIWSRVFAADDIGNAQLKKHTVALLLRGLEIPDAK